MKGVAPAKGPDNKYGTAYAFRGSPNSFIQFTNRGKLDTRYSMAMLAWVYPRGNAGPIFNYMTNNWGVHFWQTARNQFFVRFVKRRGGFTAAVTSNTLRQNRWNYIAATYNRRTGRAKLWKNGRKVASRFIGKIELRTQYSVRMGARVGDRRYFVGSIACMQVYDRALNGKQIRLLKHRCFMKGKIDNCPCF